MDAIKEKVNELSLMLIMGSADDPNHAIMLIELCKEVLQLCAVESKALRLKTATQWIIDCKESSDVASWAALFQDYVTAAVNFVENAQDCKFPHEKEVGGGSNVPADKCVQEFKDDIDPSFLAEYIETHTPMLEEFEGGLVAFQFKPENPLDLNKNVKRYLHNLKGDSGSIGVHCMERVCHLVEDSLDVRPASEQIAALVAFKEWAMSVLKALANKTPLVESSAAFLNRIQNVPTEKVAVADPSKPIPAGPTSPKEAVVAVSPSSSYRISGDKEILTEFAAEAEEHLLNIETIILEAEGVFSKDAVDTIFRGVHSVKGGSAYFTLDEMTKTAHVLENLLHEVRDGKRVFDQPLSDLVLSFIDL
jgi:HPt (histidine-containing phosphotransfer) domain-containing protein